MKRNLPTGACVLIALALVAFGLIYGTLTGYGEERAQVEALWSGENGLSDVLSYRGADGLNLCVVARRHLRLCWPWKRAPVRFVPREESPPKKWRTARWRPTLRPWPANWKAPPAFRPANAISATCPCWRRI